MAFTDDTDVATNPADPQPLTVSGLLQALQDLVAEHQLDPTATHVGVAAIGGFRSAKPLGSLSLGFDWDTGKVVLHPLQPLAAVKPEKLAAQPRPGRDLIRTLVRECLQDAIDTYRCWERARHASAPEKDMARLRIALLEEALRSPDPLA